MNYTTRTSLSIALALGGFGLLAVGCASTEEAHAPQAKKKKARKKAPKKAPRLPRGAKPGSVMFSFKNASLRRDVLPVFAQQAKVQITRSGADRRVTMRLTSPVHWEIALDLVCRFTKTHPTKDYQGRIVLKDGYGGSLGTAEEALADTGQDDKKGPTSRGSTKGRPKARAPDGGGRGYRETTANSRGDSNTGWKYNNGNKPGDLYKRLR